MSSKILVADDDFDNRAIVTETLEAQGYEVCQAADGHEALDVALRELPNVILLDLSMPKMDGWKAAERMKQIPQIANIPVIAFTAHAMSGDDAKARSAGCDDYLSKPCPPKKIVEKVRKWLK